MLFYDYSIFGIENHPPRPHVPFRWKSARSSDRMGEQCRRRHIIHPRAPNHEQTVDILKHLRARPNHIWPEYKNLESWWLLNDIAPPHTANIIPPFTQAIRKRLKLRLASGYCDKLVTLIDGLFTHDKVARRFGSHKK